MTEYTNLPGEEPGSKGLAAEPAREIEPAPGGPIPDPGETPVSKYALDAGFTLDAAVTTSQPVVLGRPKTFARANLSLAIRGVVVNAKKANQVGDDLYFVTPDAVRAGALESVAEGYEAVLVPHVDRDGTPYLSVTRMRTRDGVELESFISTTKLFQRMSQTWAKGTWVAGGYRIDEPARPDRLGDPQWPAALRSIDDWIDSAFKGKIVADPDHDVLRRLRGEV